MPKTIETHPNKETKQNKTEKNEYNQTRLASIIPKAKERIQRELKIDDECKMMNKVETCEDYEKRQGVFYCNPCQCFTCNNCQRLHHWNHTGLPIFNINNDERWCTNCLGTGKKKLATSYCGDDDANICQTCKTLRCDQLEHKTEQFPPNAKYIILDDTGGTVNNKKKKKLF